MRRVRRVWLALVTVAVAALSAGLSAGPASAATATWSGWHANEPFPVSSYGLCQDMMGVATGSDGKWLYMAVCLLKTGGLAYGTAPATQEVVVFGNTSRSTFRVSAQSVQTLGYQEPLLADEGASDGPIVRSTTILHNAHSGRFSCASTPIKPGQNLWCVAPNVTWPAGDFSYHLYPTAIPYVNGIRLPVWDVAGVPGTIHSVADLGFCGQVYVLPNADTCGGGYWLN